MQTKICTNIYIQRSTDEFTYNTHTQIYIYVKHTYMYTHTNIHKDKYTCIYIQYTYKTYKT